MQSKALFKFTNNATTKIILYQWWRPALVKIAGGKGKELYIPSAPAS